MPRETGDILKPLVALPDSVGGCWLWLGKVNAKTGYGHKQYAGKTVLAHRWMYQLFKGWVPKDRVVNHLCSNRRCVNPSHMEITTTAGNCRHGKGTKLKPEQAAAIKGLLKVARWGERKQIAKRFGVSEGLISDIKYGRAWADV
jgi:hypothetical protein